MSAFATSRVAQLLYRALPSLNFAHLVGDLHATLAGTTGDQSLLTWDCDDIAILDMDNARIIIGFSENLPGPYSATLTIAAGQSPRPDLAPLSVADRDMLCQLVADRLKRRFPCDFEQRQTIDQPLTPEVIDEVVDALFEDSRATTPPAPPHPVAPLAPAFAVGTEPGDMERLMHRLAAELTTRTPSLISKAIASATPRNRAKDAAVLEKVQSPDLPAPAQKAKLSIARRAPKVSLFWRKGSEARLEAAVLADLTSGLTAPRSASELKAVRDALYAKDFGARSLGQLPSKQHLSARAKRALQSLATLPDGVSQSLRDLRTGKAAHVEGGAQE